MVAAWLQEENAYLLYGMPKYVTGAHVVLAIGATLAFLLGCWIAATTGRVPEPTGASSTGVIRFWFYFTTLLTVVGYAAWILIGVRNGFRPGMLVELILTNDSSLSLREDLFPTIPGVTTCTQFGVAAMLLGLWLYFSGERNVIWPLAAIVGLALVRALAFSERTALLELALPGGLVFLRMCVLGRRVPALLQTGLRVAPVFGPLILVLFFGGFEYFRSWRYYQAEFSSFTEFTVWRLSGYFTTAHNNGALALEVGRQRPLPYATLRPVWDFPGLRQSSLGYKQLTRVDPFDEHKHMLERYANFELNNEGGLFQPTLDFGYAGGLLYWLGFGFIAQRLYRNFLVGTLGGVTVYPLVFMALLEVPLILFLCHPRLFPVLVSLGLVAWLASRQSARDPAASNIEFPSHSPSTAG
jgi:hypothetical protein